MFSTQQTRFKSAAEVLRLPMQSVDDGILTNSATAVGNFKAGLTSMRLTTRFLFAATFVCLVIQIASGQEAPSTKANDNPPPGVDKKYWELTHSKDPKVKGLADRYMNLVRFQEWGTASGKAVIAKYVSHDPDLKHVKLAVGKGSGKDRVITEYNIDVEKQLNKVGQARVKQIDAIQKKLDEMAATAKPGDAAGAPGGPGGVGPEGAATPGRAEHVAHGPMAAAGPEAGPPPQPAADQPDPSASDPDPLGFAELPPVAGGPPGVGAPIGPGSNSPEPGIGAGVAPPVPGQPTAGQPTGVADPKQWRTDFAAFVANIKVEKDPIGQPVVTWGELRDLGSMNQFVTTHKVPNAPASPEEESPATISQRLGDVHWQLPIEKVEQSPMGIEPHFMMPALPKPFAIQFALADGERAENWTKLAPGTPAAFTGRLLMTEPYKIVVKVKLGAK
jgi:hypothetical protein